MQQAKRNLERDMRSLRFYAAKRHNINRHSYHALPDKVYKKGRVSLFGNQALIYGTVYDDYNSCDSIQTVIEEKMPDALILGDICREDMNYYRMGQTKYMRPPLLRTVTDESIMARQQLNKLFMEDIDVSPSVFFETDKMHGVVDGKDPDDFNDHTVYEHDPLLRRKIGLPQLTAGRIVSAQHNKKVFFGGVDPLLLIEDVCARLSLKEVQEIFDKTLQ